MSRVTVGAMLVASLTVSCAVPAARPVVRIRGSDTMLELNRRLAEEYMKTHSGIPVLVEGGGTGAGVTSLVEGEIDLCAASRPFTSTEVAAIHAGSGTLGVRFLVARDALSIYLNPENPVRELTSAQLAAIFSGEITRWDAVGGPPNVVSVIIRPPSSGSHRFLRDHLLGAASFAPGATVVARTSDVVAAVERSRGAVGFGGVAQGRHLTHCKLDGADPSPTDVREGRYPLSRYLYFYAAAPPSGVVQEFVDWCLGPVGQAVVEDVGFIALWME